MEVLNLTTIRQLTRAAYGVHLADQIALVSVPLIAALVFDAPAELVGVLIACQSMAHLFGSIPFGIMVDTYQQRTLVIVATLISLVGFSGAAAGVYLSSLLWFGISVVFSGFGIVLFMLTTLSILPKAVEPSALGSANASIEIPRALASFSIPLMVGLLVSEVYAYWLFPIAAIGSAGACIFVMRLPKFEIKPGATSQGVFRGIHEGGQFVVQHGLLKAILLCAIFWNFAFSVLLVTMVPLIKDVYVAGAGTFGVALASFGLGAIVGSWTSKRFETQIAPNIILLFGPGISILAPLILYGLPPNGPLPLIYVSFFLIGFGPSMWMIAQNSVRQTVAPGHMLGRVNAVIQTAIYGVRPLAAVVAGVVIGATSPQMGLVMALIAFVLSFITATCSGLRHVKSYAELRNPVVAIPDSGN